MRYLLLSLLLLFSYSLSAQKQTYAETSGLRFDSTEVNKWLEFSEKFSTTQTDSALKYAEMALFASSQLGNQKMEIEAISAKGIAYEFAGRYKDAVIYFRQAAMLAEQEKDTAALCNVLTLMAYPLLEQEQPLEAVEAVKRATMLAAKLGDRQLQANTKNNTALIYHQLGADELFAQYLLEALSIYEELGETRRLGAINNNLGIYYFDIKKKDEAKKHYLAAESISRKIEDTQILANVTMNLGSLFRDEQNFEQATAYFKESMAAFIKMNDVRGYAGCMINYAELLRVQKKLPEALKFTAKADSLFQSGSHQFGILHAIGTRAEILLDQKKYGEAITTSRQGYEQLINSGFMPMEGKFADQLSRIYEANHEIDSAYKYFKLSAAIQDSIDAMVNKENILAFELQRKDFELNQLSLENTQKTKIISRKNLSLWFMGILLLVILIVLGFVWQLRIRDRVYQETLLQQREEIELQKQELSRLNQIKDHFISVLSHDMRSPLNSLQQSIGLIQETNFDNPQVAAWLPGIDQELNRTIWLLNDLLNWGISHMESTLDIKPLSVSSIVRENLEVIAPMAAHKGVWLVYDDVQDFLAEAEPQSLGLVIRNLLSNAVKFTPKGGKVEISISNRSPWLLIEVIDNGVGMNPGALKSWKENRYYSSMGTNREKGSGLGLTLCREMVAKMNGQMDVTSTPEKGTTFSVFLPLA